MEQQQYQHGQNQNMLYGGEFGGGAYSAPITTPYSRELAANLPAFYLEQAFDENFLGAAQKPILNTDDQDSMMNFFDNPDQGLFGYQFTHDEPVEETSSVAHGNRQWHMNGLNGATPGSATLTGQHHGYGVHGDSNTNGLSNNQSGLPVSGGDWARQAQQSMMNHEDLNAANLLQGWKRQPVSDGSPSIDSNNFANATWGNFAVHNNGNADLQTQFRTLNSQGNQPSYTSVDQSGHTSFSPQDMHQMHQMPWRSTMPHMQQQAPQPQQQPNATRARHLSLDTKPQIVRPSRTPARPDGPQSAVLPQEKPRPAPVRFGSDNNFGQHGYQGLGFVVSNEDKVGNLLGIPLANQAAKHTRGYPQGNNQQQKAGPGPAFSPVGLGGHPLAGVGNAQMPDGSWGAMAPPSHPNLDAFSVDSLPRKRRKSQHEQEDDAEYIPPDEGFDGGNMPKRGTKMPKTVASDDEGEISKAPVKRPKLGNNSMSDRSMTPVAEDYDATADQGSGKKKARSSKKQRENLSESQKRQNHIQSEKKRRDVINNGYSELGKLVPCLSTGKSGLSRSESLQEIASYLEVLVTGTADIMNMLGLSNADLPASTQIKDMTSFD